jgi:hypothetical protein
MNIVITNVYKIVLSSQTTCKNIFLDFIVTCRKAILSIFLTNCSGLFKWLLNHGITARSPPKIITLRVEVRLFVLSPEIETETKLRLTTG